MVVKSVGLSCQILQNCAKSSPIPAEGQDWITQGRCRQSSPPPCCPTCHTSCQRPSPEAGKKILTDPLPGQGSSGPLPQEGGSLLSSASRQRRYRTSALGDAVVGATKFAGTQGDNRWWGGGENLCVFFDSKAYPRPQCPTVT